MDVISSLAVLLLQLGARYVDRPFSLARGGNSYSRRHIAIDAHLRRASGLVMSNDISSLKVEDLRNKLRSRGLKVSGKKAELVARLKQRIKKEEESIVRDNLLRHESLAAEVSDDDESEVTEDDELPSWTTAAIKEKLEAAGLKSSGDRAELVATLQQYLAIWEPSSGGMSRETIVSDTPAARLSNGVSREPEETAALTLNDLKQKLKAAGLKVTGTKAELVARLGEFQSSNLTGGENRETDEQVHPRQLGTILNISDEKHAALVLPDDGGGKASIHFDFSDTVLRDDVDHANIFLKEGEHVEHHLLKAEDGNLMAANVTSPGCEYLEPRRTGVVHSFSSFSGYGFIQPDGESEKIYFKSSEVHMQYGNERVLLTAGDAVEFEVETSGDGKRWAVEVTSPDSEYVSLPSRHKGTVVSFLPREFGFIAPDDGSEKIYFKHSELHTQGQIANKDDVVEFWLMKGHDGKRWAEHITGPRSMGTIKSYSDSTGYGFISSDKGDLVYFKSSEVYMQDDSPVVLRVGEPVEYRPLKLAGNWASETETQWAEHVTSVGCEYVKTPPRITGTISRFSGSTGYGFIKPDDGSASVYLRSVDVITQDEDDSVILNVGDSVEYWAMKSEEEKVWARHVTSPGRKYMQMRPRRRGYIQRYADSKGYGFIEPDNGDPPIHFKQSEVHMQDSAPVVLEKGQPVEYRHMEAADDKPYAKFVTSPGYPYVLTPKRHKGTIDDFLGDFGFIQPENDGVRTHFHISDVYTENGAPVVFSNGDPVEYWPIKLDTAKFRAKHVTSPDSPYVKTPPRRSGSILKYNRENGYGFIQPENGDPSIYFRREEAQDADLRRGDHVEYWFVNSSKPWARHVTKSNPDKEQTLLEHLDVAELT